MLVPTQQARQGVTGHNVRYVLGFGIAAIVILFVIIWLAYFALESQSLRSTSVARSLPTVSRSPPVARIAPGIADISQHRGDVDRR